MINSSIPLGEIIAAQMSLLEARKAIADMLAIHDDGRDTPMDLIRRMARCLGAVDAQVEGTFQLLQTWHRKN